MSFREKMRVDPSQAEIQLLCALKTDDEVKHGIFFHEPIFLGFKNGRKWVITPDLSYIDDHSRVVFELDGPHHLKLRRERRDCERDERLKQLGWIVHRISYDGRKLSKWKLRKFVDEIKEVIMLARVIIQEADGK